MNNEFSSMPSADFLNAIKEEVVCGASFVPLVGSGISADSGILTGEQFTEYLAETLHRCIDRTEDIRWDLRARGWPAETSGTKKAKEWIAKTFATHALGSGLTTSDIKKLIKKEYYSYVPETQDISDVLTKDGKPDLKSFPPIKKLIQDLTPFRCPLVPEVIASPLGQQYNQTMLSLCQELNIIDELRRSPNLNSRAKVSTAAVIETAIKSLYDWRANLLFLASLRSDKQARFVLDQIDPHIIDAFNVFITKDRQPNFAHRMLAHLARPLGIHLILTTNFDKLTEQSFRDINHPLQSLPVTIIDGLPDPRTVRAHDCIIKLHGEITGTRADFTLDEAPSSNDVERFKEYITNDKIKRNILVCGFSGRDNRIVELLRACLESCDIKIFWICYSEKDAERVEALFSEYLQHKLFYTFARRLDLILYEMYQIITLSLPPGGFSYTFTHKRPPHYKISDASSNTLERTMSIAKAWAENIILKQPIPDLGDSNVKLSQEVNEGYFLLHGNNIIPLADSLFSQLEETGQYCMWLELADFVSPQAMLHDIIASFALNTGFFQLHHAEFLSNTELTPDNEDAIRGFLKRLLKFMGIDGKQWVLFLYGRTAPGASSSWRRHLWEKEQYDQLNILLKILGLRENGLQFTIIYMPFTLARLKALEKVRNQLFISAAAILGWQISWPSVPSSPDAHYKLFQQFAIDRARNLLPPLVAKEFESFIEAKNGTLAEPTTKNIFPTEANVDNRISVDENHVETKTLEAISRFVLDEWLGGRHIDGVFCPKPKELHFLYGLLLFRQSRHPNAVLSDAVLRCPRRFNEHSIDNDENRQECATKFMDRLYQAGVFLEKPGGYAWIYREVRTSLIAILESILDINSDNNSHFDFTGQLRGRSHDWIADWYLKAFFSTGHILPLLESFFHRARSLTFSPFIKHGSQNHESDTERDKILRERILLAHKALNQCYKHLLLCRPWLKYWLCDKVPMRAFTDKLDVAFTEIVSPLADVTVLKTFGKGIALAPVYERLKTLSSEIKLAKTEIAGNVKNDKTEIFVPHFSNKDLRLPGNEAPSHNPESDAPSYSLTISDLQHPQRHRQSLQQALETQKYHCFSEPYFTKLKPSELSNIRRTWLLENITAPHRIATVVSVLSELAYVFVKRAKLFDHVAKVPGGVPREALEKEAQMHFLYVCKVCYEGLQLLPHLDASYLQYEVIWQSKLQTLYGLALAKLGRHFESHRRLNEAEALLSKASSAINPLELAKIRTRRAEVFLIEADAASEKWDKVKKSQSYKNGAKELGSVYAKKVDDAWSTLEDVERLLASRSHSSLWWGRWIILSFRAFTLPKEKNLVGMRDTLPYIRTSDPVGHCRRLYEMSQFISENDNYRQCRFTNYFLDAIESFEQGGLSVNKNDIMTDLATRARIIKKKCIINQEHNGEFLTYLNWMLRRCNVDSI